MNDWQTQLDHWRRTLDADSADPTLIAACARIGRLLAGRDAT